MSLRNVCQFVSDYTSLQQRNYYASWRDTSASYTWVGRKYAHYETILCACAERKRDSDDDNPLLLHGMLPVHRARWRRRITQLSCLWKASGSNFGWHKYCLNIWWVSSVNWGKFQVGFCHAHFLQYAFQFITNFTESKSVQATNSSYIKQYSSRSALKNTTLG
jgi:hypothetical protein